MPYLTQDELLVFGFKNLGKNVSISNKCSIYNAESISIGDHSRVDDFCVLSGNISIGRNCHVTPMCLIAGGMPGVEISDYCTLAYGVKIFSQSDDYSGASMVNSTIPKKYKREIFSKVSIEKHVIVGAGSIIMPGTTVSEGCAVGALSLITRSTEPWGVYVGSPAKRISNRKKDILQFEIMYLQEETK